MQDPPEAALADEEYEPDSPKEDPGEDLVPFINGRLDEEDEDKGAEDSGRSNEGSSSGHRSNAGAENEDSSTKQPTAEAVHKGNAGPAENEHSNAKQPTAEVSGHQGNAGAENQNSSAKQPTAEVSGHQGNARAENQDPSAKQPAAEVSGHPGNAGAKNQDSSAEQPTAEVSGHMSGNSAVLASMTKASAQPELLIVCSDDEAVAMPPMRPVPTPARAGLPVSRQEHLETLKRQLWQLSLCMHSDMHICVFVCTCFRVSIICRRTQFTEDHLISTWMIHVSPRKQKKEAVKASFRRDGPPHDDPSRWVLRYFLFEHASGHRDISPILQP